MTIMIFILLQNLLLLDFCNLLTHQRFVISKHRNFDLRLKISDLSKVFSIAEKSNFDSIEQFKVLKKRSLSNYNFRKVKSWKILKFRLRKRKFHNFDFSQPLHRYIYSKRVLKKRIGNDCASQGVRWERGKPRSRFQAIREICLRRNARSQRHFPPFYVRGIIGSENHHPPFPAITILWTKAFACVSTVYIHTHICTHSHRGNHHPSFFPPPSLGAPITPSLSHSRACRVGCVRIAFRCAFTGG